MYSRKIQGAVRLVGSEVQRTVMSYNPRYIIGFPRIVISIERRYPKMPQILMASENATLKVEIKTDGIYWLCHTFEYYKKTRS